MSILHVFLGWVPVRAVPIPDLQERPARHPHAAQPRELKGYRLRGVWQRILQVCRIFSRDVESFAHLCLIPTSSLIN